MTPRRLDLFAFHLDAQILGAQPIAVLSAAHAAQHHIGVLKRTSQVRRGKPWKPSESDGQKSIR